MEKIKKFRQKYLDEKYYKKCKEHLKNSIDFFLNDKDSYINYTGSAGEIEIKKQPNWKFLADCYKELLYLEYTAWEDIEKLKEYLYKILEYQENTEKAICESQNDKRIMWNLGSSSEDILPLISLAYLLNCRDLLEKIELFANWERWKKWITDAMTDIFFKFNNKNQTLRNYDEDFALFLPEHRETCKYIHENNMEELLKNLEKRLKSRNNRKFDFYYNWHNKQEEWFFYFGYWNFEIACLVYLLNLDDNIFHKSLYYPKDLVDYARKNYPI